MEHEKKTKQVLKNRQRDALAKSRNIQTMRRFSLYLKTIFEEAMTTSLKQMCQQEESCNSQVAIKILSRIDIVLQASVVNVTVGLGTTYYDVNLFYVVCMFVCNN